MPDCLDKTFTATHEADIRPYQYRTPKNASKVVSDIINAVEKAIPNPEIYTPDKFKKDNDRSYRAFEKHHYRITQNVIRVLSIRHTSRAPKTY